MGKFVGKVRKSFTEIVDKKVIHIFSGKSESFPRCSGKVLQVVLHTV